MREDVHQSYEELENNSPLSTTLTSILRLRGHAGINLRANIPNDTADKSGNLYRFYNIRTCTPKNFFKLRLEDRTVVAKDGRRALIKAAQKIDLPLHGTLEVVIYQGSFLRYMLSNAFNKSSREVLEFHA